jgi:histidine phosphotransfer protein HptB
MGETTIDRATFRALQDTAGAEFVKDLVDTFLEEAPVMLGDLRESLDAGEADRFRRAAHTLKSNSNTFGAHAFGALAKELELAGLERVRAMTPPPLDALADAYAQVAASLRELSRA